jgi:hypothetical protein
MYVNKEDRVTKRKVSDEELNEAFQEALKYDPSLMIEEYPVIKRRFLRKPLKTFRYSVYHETPAFDNSPYQARLQFSASGDKRTVITYLHGIINGIVNQNSNHHQ